MIPCCPINILYDKNIRTQRVNIIFKEHMDLGFLFNFELIKIVPNNSERTKSLCKPYKNKVIT